MNAIVINADGWFGDYATVWFAGDAKAAERFAERHSHCQVIYGVEGIAKGEKISRGELSDIKAIVGN